MGQRDWAWFRPRLTWTALAVLAILAILAILAMVMMLPAMASADPVPPTVPADPGAPPPPPDPETAPAPDPNRVSVDAAGFSYELPDDWAVGDASKITYGQALLTKTPEPGTPPATDAAIMLGTLDQRLFASAEPDNVKAAARLASDMGEFFMPFPGIRVNRQSTALNAAGVPGAAAYYEVKFTDTSKPNGQIWAAALGSVTPHPGAQPTQDNNRWFVVCLGTADNPIDLAAARTLAESIRPLTAPAPADQLPPDQNATQVPANNTPPPPGAPAPAQPNPEMTPSP